MVPEPNSASGSGTTRDVESVKVPSKDPKKKDEKKDEDLSEEDLALKQQLELYVERVQDSDPGLQKVALESIRQEIRTSTSSMTSVPKPLKFLRPHYGTLKAHYETLTASDIKKLLADILSVLTLTMSAEGERESLKYRLLGSEGDIGSWGHEYVRKKMGDATKENVMESVRSVVFKQSETLEGFCTKIEGYDFNRGVNYTELLSSMLSTGFQASNLGDAIQVVNQMLDWRLADEFLAEDCSEEERERGFRESVKSKLFLGFTSNLVSSGVRDTIRYLVQHHMVDVVVTTAGGVEEDLIKCLAPTYRGDFSLAGAALRSKGLNRIGNLLVPNDNYCKFEDWIIPIFDQMLEEQTEKGVLWTPSKVIARLGKEINHESSYLYWAYKNNIPVYCPGITDGSLGDMLYFHSFRNPGLVIDLVQDIRAMNSEAVHASPSKTGMIILGGGLPKHHICNANMMRNGADFAIFINTAQEFDGSDSGAHPDEAVSWGKIRGSAKTVKVHCDATIAFPLLVAETFAARRKNYPEAKP